MHENGNLFGYEGWGIISDKEELGKVGGVVVVIRVAAVLPLPMAEEKGGGRLLRKCNGRLIHHSGFSQLNAAFTASFLTMPFPARSSLNASKDHFPVQYLPSQVSQIKKKLVCHLCCVFTYIYSLLIEKEVCDHQNISNKFVCAFSLEISSTFGRSFPFISHILCLKQIQKF